MVLQWCFLVGKKPKKSPNWKALHYKFSFFYKFSVTSSDLPSLYWVSMNKLKREVACLITSIYKANLKLFQQSCSDACGAWYSLCWSQIHLHQWEALEKQTEKREDNDQDRWSPRGSCAYWPRLRLGNTPWCKKLGLIGGGDQAGRWKNR